MLSRPSFAALAVAVSFASVACSAPPPDLEGDPGAGAEAITVAARSGTCNRTKVMASVSGARRRVLERGFAWLDKNVPYSQSRSFEGYRTDCSGFVSMCWETGTSFTTAIYSSGGGNASTLRTWNELVPGDALVRNGHMMLFTGWADSAKTGICALEQASTASDMQFRVRSVASLRGQSYKPIRSRKLGSVSAPTPSEEEELNDPNADMPSGEEDEPVADPPDVQEPAPRPTEPRPTTPPSVDEPEEPEEPAEPEPEPKETPEQSTPEADAPEDEPTSSSSSSGSTSKKKKASSTTRSSSDDEEAFVPQSNACAVGGLGPSPVRSPGGVAFAGLGLALVLGARRRRAMR